MGNSCRLVQLWDGVGLLVKGWEVRKVHTNGKRDNCDSRASWLRATHASGASYGQLGVIFESKGEIGWMGKGARGFQGCSLVMGLCKASVRTSRMVGWPLELAWEAEICMDKPPSMGKGLSWNSLGRSDLVQREKLHVERVL